MSTANLDERRMAPMTIHYALQEAEEGQLPVAIFSVEIEGGSLSTAAAVPDADPAYLGSMAGILCNHLHLNARYFPGEDLTARIERRHLHFGNRQFNGQAMPQMAEFDVTFTPVDPQ